MMSFQKLRDWPFRNWLAAICALALLARAWVVMEVLQAPERVILWSDSQQYLAAADGLYETGRFVTQYDQYLFSTGGGYAFEIVRTPGYPAVIALLRALTGEHPPLAAIPMVQAIVGAGIAVLAALLGRRMFDVRTGVLAGFLYAIAPISAIMVGFAYAETMFSLWMILGAMAALAGVERNRLAWSAIGGLLYGIAMLTRPIGLPLVPLLTLIPLAAAGAARSAGGNQKSRKGRLEGPPRRPALAVALGCLLLAGGWMARNSYRFGRFTLSAVSDINLFYYNAASLEAHRQGISLDIARGQLAARLAAMPEPENKRWPTSNYGQLGREVILAHPVQFVWYNGIDALNGLRPGFSFLVSLMDGESGRENPMEAFSSDEISPAMIVRAISEQDSGIAPLEAAMALHEVIVVGLGLIGVAMLAARRNWRAVVALGLIPALLMYLPGAASNARFRSVIEPYLAIAAAAATWTALAALRERQARKRLAIRQAPNEAPAGAQPEAPLR